MDPNATETLVKQVRKAEQALKSGRRVDAVMIYEDVAERAGADPATNSALGHLSLQFGNSYQAVGHFRTALAAEPDNPYYHGSLGLALQREARSEEAIESYNKALALDDGLAFVLHGLGAIYLQRADYAAAKAHLEKAQRITPGDGAIRTNLATVLGHLNQHDVALKHAEKGLKSNSGSPVAHYTYGNILAQLGRVDDAVRHFEKTIREHQDFGGAYVYLARLRKFGDADKPFINKVEKVLKRSLPAQERYCIHYALGKMYDDCQEYDRAFEHYRQANLLKKRDYDLKRDKQIFSKVKKFFDAKTLKEYQALGNPSATPVFIVGLPRSGTTLMERMIASHPRGAGAGELPEIPRIANLIVPPSDSRRFGNSVRANLTEENISTYAAGYLDVLRQAGPDAERIVDKLPGNFFFLWLVLVLFPNATIINAVRHPLDACLSCYFQNFSNIRWANDLQLIGNIYSLYRDIINYWKSVLPEGRIVDARYEALVEDPEVHGKSLLESCGLDWDPDSLSFYAKDKVVKTASVWQVRQPIYKSSRMRWKNYAPHLADLANSLAVYLQEDREELGNHGIDLAAASGPGFLRKFFN